ncbi:hypothetical protein RJ639_043473 [Escallonia herrerae]|uniref:Bet v I/Major latex protein domain-containing protein n=1 Tax=Escallonia herrerae TaxID=1293975 RepID=A0AA89B3R7_9ASTE|nr:hypothetical protein RJ639_043473 [Escallonia herrerae]
MGLIGKMVRQTNVKFDGDVFHKIFTHRPHQMSTISPDNVKAVNLQEGGWGSTGSIIVVNFVHDGKQKVAEEIIEAVDEEKQSVTYKVIGGDLMELYKTFRITVHVDTKGEDNLVTWTFEYEKLNAGTEDPDTLMDFCLNVTKDIETHHILQQKYSHTLLFKFSLFNSSGPLSRSTSSEPKTPMLAFGVDG